MTAWVILGQFFHGLMFFALGLSVCFLNPTSKRITLARRLSWLCVFAFSESSVAWYELLASFSPQIASVPVLIPVAVRALGYVYLAAFGAQTLLSVDASEGELNHLLRKLLTLCLVVFVLVWGFLSLQVSPSVLVDCSRLFLAFPGGVLAAVGLRKRGRQTFDAELQRRIRGHIRVVEAMAALFGLLNLLVVVQTWLGDLLPQVLTIWLWGLVGAAFTWGLVSVLTTVQSEVVRWIEGVERLQALALERERISRELHDSIIQSIYAAGLLLEGVLNTLPHDPARAQAQLQRVMERLNRTIQDLRRYIFDLRSDLPDADLREGIEQLLHDFHINTLLETELVVTGEPVAILSAERRRHMLQIVREALTNTARHAQAHRVKIHIHYGEALEITISDDGIGMATLPVSTGYGLRNIRERARLLDGRLRVESAPGEGVTYHLLAPY